MRDTLRDTARERQWRDGEGHSGRHGLVQALRAPNFFTAGHAGDYGGRSLGSVGSSSFMPNPPDQQAKVAPLLAWWTNGGSTGLQSLTTSMVRATLGEGERERELLWPA
jgi:hypothetical protein